MSLKNLLTRIAIFLASILIFCYTWYIVFPEDVVNEFGRHGFGLYHVMFNLLMITFWVILVLNTIHKIFESDKVENDLEFNLDMKINKKKVWVFSAIAVLLYFTVSFYGGVKNMYNKSKVYHNNYTQKVQEKQGFYDKLWKTYSQKENIANLNKDTFIKVTQLIMENRRDGDKLAWKWVQENQNIPYTEFTKFYSDLSYFIEEQREGYFAIEKECQKIANQNNTLLDTLPNNLYNKVAGCKKIDFEYGFLSDSTENVFKTKKENL